jgi:hypothetical protein
MRDWSGLSIVPTTTLFTAPPRLLREAVEFAKKEVRILGQG